MLNTRKEKLRHAKAVWVAIHDILLRDWDPIHVQDEPNAQDEYDSYIPSVRQLLERGACEEALVTHLDEITTRRMGFTSIPEAGRSAARALITFWQADKVFSDKSNEENAIPPLRQ